MSTADAMSAVTPDMATAFHEAGHAVVGHHLGIGIRKLTIVKDEDYLGATFHYAGRPMSDDQLYSPDARTRTRLEKHIIGTWAGPLAEERATGWNDGGAGLTAPFEHPEHGPVRRLAEGGDMLRIIEMAELLHGSGRTADAYMEYLRLRTLDIIEHAPFVWPQIEAVATALVEHPTLTGRQFRDVCQRVVDDALAPGLARLAKLMGPREEHLAGGSEG